MESPTTPETTTPVAGARLAPAALLDALNAPALEETRRVLEYTLSVHDALDEMWTLMWKRDWGVNEQAVFTALSKASEMRRLRITNAPNDKVSCP